MTSLEGRLLAYAYAAQERMPFLVQSMTIIDLLN